MEALLRERCTDLTEHEVKHAAQALTKPEVGVTNQAALQELQQQGLQEAGAQILLQVVQRQDVVEAQNRQQLEAQNRQQPEAQNRLEAQIRQLQDVMEAQNRQQNRQQLEAQSRLEALEAQNRQLQEAQNRQRLEAQNRLDVLEAQDRQRLQRIDEHSRRMQQLDDAERRGKLVSTNYPALGRDTRERCIDGPEADAALQHMLAGDHSEADMTEAVKLITPLWSAALKSESDSQGRWDKSFITAFTLRNSNLAYIRTAEKPMAKQKPDAVTVAGTHMALPVHVVGVHELKLKDTLGEQNTALGQISTRFVSIKLKDFNSDSSKWLRCGEQGLVPDGLRRIVQLAWSNPQNQGWFSPDLPESAFLELDNRPIRVVDSLATLRLVPSAASSAAAAPGGSSSRLAAVLGGLLLNGTPIALKGGLEGHLQKELANFESVVAVLGIAHSFGFATTSDGRRLLTVCPRGEAVAPETTAQLLTFCFLALFCVSRLAAAGKVHGDISPGNFTMVPPGLPLLIDLHTLQPSGEEPAGVTGTTQFAALSQLARARREEDGAMAAAPSDASDAEAVFYVTSFFCAGGNLPWRHLTSLQDRLAFDAKFVSVQFYDRRVAPRFTQHPTAKAVMCAWAKRLINQGSYNNAFPVLGAMQLLWDFCQDSILSEMVHDVHLTTLLHDAPKAANNRSSAQQAAVQARDRCKHLIHSGSGNEEASVAALETLRQSMINYVRSLHS